MASSRKSRTGSGGLLEEALARILPELDRIRREDPAMLPPLLHRLSEEVSLMNRMHRTNDAPNVLTVENGKYRLDTLLDGTARLRNIRRSRLLVMLMANPRFRVQPSDMEEAGRGRPFRIVAPPPPPPPTARLEDEESLPAALAEAGFEDSGDDGAEPWRRALPEGQAEGVDGLLRPGSGDMGQRMAAVLDAEADRITQGIADAMSSGDHPLAAGLEAQRKELGKWRAQYVNPLTGGLRPLLGEKDRLRVKRISMCLYRAAADLAAEAPRTAEKLRRGMSLAGPVFRFDPEPGSEWLVRLEAA